MSDNASCELIIPGFISAVSCVPQQTLQTRFPSLYKFFIRATEQKSNSTFYRHISDFFNHSDTGADFPLAAVTAQQLNADSGVWLRAVPVRLFPDRDCLIMSVADEKIPKQTADEISALLLSHFSTEFTEIHFIDDVWLFKLAADASVCTFSILDAIGKNVDQFLPQGQDRTQWHALGNEIQMLLHQFNHTFQFNALWLESVGSVDTLKGIKDCESAILLSADKALQDAAAFLGYRFYTTLEEFHWPEKTARVLTVDDRLLTRPELREYDRLLNWLDETEALLLFALQALKQNRIDCIRLFSLDGHQYQLKKSDLWRFWRRTSPFEANMTFVDSHQ